MAQEQQDQVQVKLQTGDDEEREREALLASTQTETPVAAEQVTAEDAAATSAEAPVKRRVRKRGKLVNAEDVLPRPSIWPLVFASGLALLCFGFISLPFIMAIGGVLLVASVFGLALERRR